MSKRNNSYSLRLRVLFVFIKTLCFLDFFLPIRLASALDINVLS